MAWTVTRSRHALKDRWISVRADDCVTETGAELKPYYVFEYPDFVHVLAIDPDRNVVLVRQYRHGLGHDSLELPGGMQDADDPDPVATAIRELREETGLEGREVRTVLRLATDPAKLTNRLHLVLAEDVRPAGRQELDLTENITVQRVPLSGILDLVRRGGIQNAQHVGLLLLGLEAAGLISIAER